MFLRVYSWFTSLSRLWSEFLVNVLSSRVEPWASLRTERPLCVKFCERIGQMAAERWPRTGWQYVLPKLWYQPTNPHDVATRKNINMPIAVQTFKYHFPTDENYMWRNRNQRRKRFVVWFRSFKESLTSVRYLERLGRNVAADRSALLLRIHKVLGLISMSWGNLWVFPVPPSKCQKFGHDYFLQYPF